MTRPLCSVVIATYDRCHLMRRSVVCYNRSLYPLDRLEVVIVDDGSTDDVAGLCTCFDPAIDVKLVRLRKPAGLWRDCAAVINHGIRVATGEYILITHPEVMPGRESLAHCEAFGTDNVYSCCKPYYLRPRDQERIDSCNWIEDGPIAVRQIEGFYEDHDENQPPGYTPRRIEAEPNWHSWVFGGFRRETWKRLGGMIETQKWGSVDLVLHMRRERLGIVTVTGTRDGTLCVHQNHDDPAMNIPAPRDIDAAHAEAVKVDMTPSQLVYPAVDHLW